MPRLTSMVNEPTFAMTFCSTALRAQLPASLASFLSSQKITCSGRPLMPPLALMYSWYTRPASLMFGYGVTLVSIGASFMTMIGAPLGAVPLAAVVAAPPEATVVAAAAGAAVVAAPPAAFVVAVALVELLPHDAAMKPRAMVTTAHLVRRRGPFLFLTSDAIY